MLSAKLGISPIAWWNDDDVNLSDDVSLEEALRQPLWQDLWVWKPASASP